jgi:Ca-activated chloride channel homolog
MPTLTLELRPRTAELDLLAEPQVCYVLLTARAEGPAGPSPVSWALVADASRSMRIPIVDEQVFRELVRSGGAQETLVDGVPVWQLSGPVPASVREAAPSALDYVARALHTVVERLDASDRFALIACAEEAVLLAPGTSGAERAALAGAIGRLPDTDLGERTDLARGLALALGELRAARSGGRTERIVLLTDGFSERPSACLELAAAAAAEGISISTVGLGGEFEESLLTAMADRSGGRAMFLRGADEIPPAVSGELAQARSVAARGATLRVATEPGVTLRRVTRVRPSLAILHQAPEQMAPIPLGDLAAGGEVAILLELIVSPRPAGSARVAGARLEAAGGGVAAAEITALFRAGSPALDPAVRAAAARTSVALLQRRAAEQHGNPAEAARLLRAAAARLDELGEHALAGVAREQAADAERGGRPSALATKELTYATRRLGEG